MKLVDLSQTLENGMCVFPGAPEATFEKIGNLEKGDSYTLTKFSMTTHVGTHIDCTSHTIPGGYTTDSIDMGFFTGSGIVIDCSGYADNAVIGTEILDKYDISEKEFIIFHTAWDKYWGQDKYWNGFKVLSDELYDYLSASKAVKGVGVDYGTIDPLEDAKLSKHVRFFQNKKTIIENLTNLECLLNKDFTFMAFPLKFKNGDGSPVRAIAMLDEA